MIDYTVENLLAGDKFWAKQTLPPEGRPFIDIMDEAANNSYVFRFGFFLSVCLCNTPRFFFVT